mmetsp:Transcript_16115/g.34839  ORF Transcript_16115/g.34839 Transcript_16115/m.34839 type:complete len:213 (+) Transcript_16115:864-1502(+)
MRIFRSELPRRGVAGVGPDGEVPRVDALHVLRGVDEVQLLGSGQYAEEVILPVLVELGHLLPTLGPKVDNPHVSRMEEAPEGVGRDGIGDVPSEWGVSALTLFEDFERLQDDVLVEHLFPRLTPLLGLLLPPLLHLCHNFALLFFVQDYKIRKVHRLSVGKQLSVALSGNANHPLESNVIVVKYPHQRLLVVIILAVIILVFFFINGWRRIQ